MHEFRSRLTKGFEIIRKQGYFARQNWQCCQTCGCAALPEDVKNYVFYHHQDAKRIREDFGVYLAWGGDGSIIKQAFEKAGLTVDWDGGSSTRLYVRSLSKKPVLTEDKKYVEQMEALIGTMH